MKKQFTKFAGAALCAALSTVGFSQTALAPGQVSGLTTLPSSTEAAYLANVLVNPTFVVDPFVGMNAQSQVVFTGTLYEGVWTDLNTGGLDFFFQLYNDSTSPDAIADLTLTHFAGVNTSVLEFDDASAGAGIVSRDNTGDVIGFNFLNFGGGYNSIAPGTFSDTVGILTNATQTMAGSAQIQDGGNVVVPILSPTAVPEPAPMSVLALGGLVFLRRRKKA